MKIRSNHIRIAKVVGENEDGLTLFVPKDMSGTFTLEAGDRFLTMVFMRQRSEFIEPWIPWEKESNND